MISCMAELFHGGVLLPHLDPTHTQVENHRAAEAGCPFQCGERKKHDQCILVDDMNENAEEPQTGPRGREGGERGEGGGLSLFGCHGCAKYHCYCCASSTAGSAVITKIVTTACPTDGAIPPCRYTAGSW